MLAVSAFIPFLNYYLIKNHGYATSTNLRRVLKIHLFTWYVTSACLTFRRSNIIDTNSNGCLKVFMKNMTKVSSKK